MRNTFLAAALGLTIGMAVSAYADQVRPEPVRPAPIVREVMDSPAVEEIGPRRTDLDVDLLARVIYWEAGNQDEWGKRLVADVILNRVHDPRFPESIRDVIYQENQFSVSGILYTAEPTEDCYRIAMEELVDQADWEVVWFNCGDYLPFGEQAYQYGDHYFSK